MRRVSKGARAVVAALFLVFASILAVRSAIIAAFGEKEPLVATAFWPGHPDILASSAMLAVAHAAVRGDPVPEETTKILRELSRRSPLAPEPFLVAGASALRLADYARAEQLLLAARQRDPRSEAARYLLTELYLRQGRELPALEELAALRRLMPSSASALAPALAQYAKSAGASARLRKVLGSDPELESLVLTELASDHANVSLILSLATDRNRSASTPAWPQRLIASLVQAGEYKRAHDLWRTFAPASETSGGLSVFHRSSSGSPFAWSFADGSAGAAEPRNGKLDVVFTGRDNVALASRIVLLPPGLYGISLRVKGDLPEGEAVSWSVTCMRDSRRLANIAITRTGALKSRFEIPATCSAQRVELKGLGLTYPETAEFEISSFKVKRLASR